MKTIITNTNSSGIKDKEYKELMKILYWYPKRKKFKNQNK